MKRMGVLTLVLFITAVLAGCRTDSADELGFLMPQISAQQQMTVTTSSTAAVQDVTVYITENGECYHRESCRCLLYTKTEIPLSKALLLEYRPCSWCVPPTE